MKLRAKTKAGGFSFEEKHPGTPRRRIAFAASAAGFVTFLNMWCVQAILPVLAAGLHVSQAATGYTVTAALVATAAIAPLIGIVSDRFGRKRFIAGAAFLLVIPTLLAAFAVNLPMLVACRFAQGLLLPFIFTVTIAYIGDEFSGPVATRLVGIYTAGTILGGFSGRAITGFVTEFFGWRAAFFVIGLLTLALALLVAWFLPKERNFRPVPGLARALRSFPDHLSNPRLLGTYAVGFGVLFSLVCMFTFINFRLAAAPYHLGPAALGAIFVVYLGGVAVSPVTGRAAVRHGRRAVMVVTVAAIMLGLALTLVAPLWVVMLGLLAMTCGVFAQQTLATSFVGVAARSAKSTAVGLYVTIYYIGGSFGGTLPAMAWRDAGWAGCVAIVAAMQALMLAVALAAWREGA